MVKHLLLIGLFSIILMKQSAYVNTQDDNTDTTQSDNTNTTEGADTANTEGNKLL